ncbi:MAG: HD domain-containing protein [Lachnospiraceae bacterium]|nr:HD domain-containing protein [Lachnospiraceae bacterium]
MGRFSFGKWKNEVIDMNTEDADSVLSAWADYIVQEDKKGKIPLIIVGAGVSACDVKIQKSAELEFAWSKKGLPCLQQMMMKLKELVENAAEESSGEGFEELKKHFQIMTDDMRDVNREWLGRTFTLFEKSEDEEIKNIWREFCDWFFFSCIEYSEGGKPQFFGALNTKTSKAAVEIVKMYDSVNAICLSANFDNYINYALTETDGYRKGVSIFDKEQAERYLKRIRRGGERFEEKPYNRCVLHANGDVFWLYCSGEKGEDYCPNTGIRKPAFGNSAILGPEDLYCDFCGSPLIATMTMPGTYEKDYNTRIIIESIWKYLSARVSAVISIGISCNWDDVLLKFILQLMKEMDIPLLDINSFTDQVNKGTSQLVELVVKQSYLEACSIRTDALEGVERLNELIGEKKALLQGEKSPEEDNDKHRMKIELLKEKFILRLKHVSQLGLKSYWLETEEKNERWGHSVEVAEIAVQMYTKLIDNSRKNRLPHEEILLYAAGLLHDCGHLPFSHLLEDVFEELSWSMQGETETFTHAHYTKWMIKQLCNNSGNKFNEIIKKYDILPEEIINLIEGRYGVAYIDTIINGALDADKVAYIFTDAEKSKRNLMLDKDEFLTKLLGHAYISQEGMIALDGESAWYAMRLLDERQRMYKELYYDTRIRCLEAMAKYIITTYFVQKYNNTAYIMEEAEIFGEDSENLEDMGNRHIMDAINDLYEMIEEDRSYPQEDLSASVGEKIKEAVEQCMQFIMCAKRSRSEKDPDELKILKFMCSQLLGREVKETEIEENLMTYVPYRDRQLDELVEKLSYGELMAIRKKIILNYPGTILIDIYKTAKYFSPSALRAARRRPDGTNCEQTTILVPEEPRSEWQTQHSKARISLAEYAEKNDINKERKVVFHLFRIGHDAADCNHAINMLKKEMKKEKK